MRCRWHKSGNSQSHPKQPRFSEGRGLLEAPSLVSKVLVLLFKVLQDSPWWPLQSPTHWKLLQCDYTTIGVPLIEIWPASQALSSPGLRGLLSSIPLHPISFLLSLPPFLPFSSVLLSFLLISGSSLVPEREPVSSSLYSAINFSWGLRQGTPHFWAIVFLSIK